MKKWLLVIIIGLIVFRFYDRHRNIEAATPVAAIDSAAAGEDTGPERPDPPAASGYRCDGRTRCPQMRSCEEAEFFLSHCPGVKMDGDNDGLACEDQFCGH